jgi:hypothetical protein
MLPCVNYGMCNMLRLGKGLVCGDILIKRNFVGAPIPAIFVSPA